MFRYFAWLRFEKARLDGAGFMSGLERTKIFNEVDFTGFDTQGEKKENRQHDFRCNNLIYTSRPINYKFWILYENQEFIIIKFISEPTFLPQTFRMDYLKNLNQHIHS